MLKQNFVAVSLIAVALCVTSEAQVPREILSRVYFISTTTKTGTAFVLERNNRQYLVTAKHMVESLPKKNAKLSIYTNSGWQSFTASVINCKNPKVDVAVLEPASLSLPVVGDPPDMSTEGAIVGQEVYFMGFPKGLFTVAPEGEQYPVPFVKHGVLSALDWKDHSTSLWFVDAINNHGFSGGPIAFLDGHKNQWRIGAVVMGYSPEPAEIRVGNHYVASKYLVNSGVMIGYEIHHALDALQGQ